MTTVSRTLIFIVSTSLGLIAVGCDRQSSSPDRGDSLLESDIATSSEPRRPRPRPSKARPAPGDERPNQPPAQNDAGVGQASDVPSLAPPDAGFRSTAAPIQPGDFLPSTGPAESPASLDLDQAVAEVEQQGPPCEHSFGVLQIVARNANRAVPRRDVYLRACELLPFMMQRCLDPAFREENEQDCDAVRSQTDPALLEGLRQVVELESE